MSNLSERPRDMRARDRDTFDFGSNPQKSLPVPSRGAGGRGAKTGGVDNGTVAMAVSAMTFYWMLPMVLGRGKRRPRPASRPPTGDSQA